MAAAHFLQPIRDCRLKDTQGACKGPFSTHSSLGNRTWAAVRNAGMAYRGVLQLIEEVLAMLSAPELAQSQTTDNWDQHEPNAEVLRGNVLGFTNKHHWVMRYFQDVVHVLCRLYFSVSAQGHL